MKLIDIDCTQFEQIDVARRIITHDPAWRYAIADLGDWGKYGLSWHSDLIEPSILENSLIWLGVDQKLVALRQGSIQVAMPLVFSLLDIVQAENVTIVVTELEILVFNADGSLRFTEGLPDIATNWSVQDNQLSLELLDQSTLLLDLQTGKTLSSVRA